MTVKPSFVTPIFFLLAVLSLALAARAESDPAGDFAAELSRKYENKNGGDGGGFGGFFGPGPGFGIPGIGNGIGGGYGGGYGGPGGGFGRGGVVRPTVVCKDKGPCYMKKLRCPAKCFKSFSRSGKGYGGGGGGGGCTMDCKKTCTAYC